MPSVANPNNSKRLLSWVIYFVLLGLFDALATDVGIRMHWVYEANPLAKVLYETNIALFYAWKVLLPLALWPALPYVSRSSLICWLMIGATAIYALLDLYHVSWMLYLLFGRT